MEAINKKGYVTDKSLLRIILPHILNPLFSFGYKKKIQGNSELTNSPNYNFIFINLHYLLENKLQELKGNGYVVFKILVFYSDCEDKLVSVLEVFK